MQSPYSVNKKFRSRAAESMQQQHKVLLEDPKPVSQDLSRNESTRPAATPTSSTSNADKLRSMLSGWPSISFGAGETAGQQGTSTRSHQCVVPHPGELPSPEETVLVLEHQTAYTQQVENELCYTKEELAAVKVKLSEVMQDNVRLQNELRQNIVREIIGGQASVTPQRTGSSALQDRQPGRSQDMELKADFGKWQLELDRISSLHKARNEALEAQLVYSKDELLRSRAMVDELQSRLRRQESLSAMLESGVEKLPRLCVSCALAPAVAATGSGSVLPTEWEQLRREKEDAVEALSRVMSQLSSMQSREEEACDRVKACIELMEEAQREKGEVIVQREHIREELERSRQRWESAAADHQRQLADIRDAAKSERQHELNDLETRLKHATDEEAASKTELMRLVRDKRDLEQQLQQSKFLVQQGEVAVAEATSKLRVELSRLSLERDAAVEERYKLKSNLKKMEDSHEELIQRLRHEADALRRRLDVAEAAALSGKEESIKLVTEIQRLEKEVASAKMALSTLERNRSEELAAISSRLEQREKELCSQLQAAETQLDLHRHEMQSKIEAQSGLIEKLREECRRQAGIIESTSAKHRMQTKQMKKDAKVLQHQLSAAQQAVRRLNQQTAEHAQVHDRLREHVANADAATQQVNQHNNQLCAKNQELQRELEILSNELRLLRLYADNGGAAGTQDTKVQSSLRPCGMIGDILAALSSDMADQDRTLLNGISILRQAAAASHDQ